MKFSVLVLLALALAACNSGKGRDGDDAGNSGGGSTPPVALSVAGIWQGTYKVGGAAIDNLYCVVSEKNELVCFMQDPADHALSGAMHSAKLAVAGSKVTGSGVAFAVVGKTLPDGSTQGTFSFSSGTIDPQKTLTLDATVAGTQGTISLQFDPGYNRGSSLAAVQGTYSQTNVNGQSASFVIDADGSLRVQTTQAGAQCYATGKVAGVDPAYDAYAVTMTLTGCTNLDGDYSGLGFIADSNAGAGQTDNVFWLGVFDTAGARKGIATAAVK